MSERPHRKLVVWQKAVELVADVYRVTARFPGSERFGLSSQMRRAAVSIPSNIAEGAARSGHREYTRFLYVARGSASELDTQLEIALRLGYLDDMARVALQSRVDEVNRMLNGMIVALSRRAHD